jgi:broad specificity phosphatase PhoE
MSAHRALESHNSENVVYSWTTLREGWSRALVFPKVEADIVRHGQTEYNARGLVSGGAEVALSELGRQQAVHVARLLRPPYRLILVSSMSRAVETLEIALKYRGLPLAYEIDSRLNERSLGVLEGRPRVHVKEFAEGNLDFAPPGGESYRSVAQRCMSFMLDVQKVMSAWPPGGRILICTHQGPMRILHGVMHEERSPSRILGGEWGNALMVRQTLTNVRWPRFLRDAVIASRS